MPAGAPAPQVSHRFRALTASRLPWPREQRAHRQRLAAVFGTDCARYLICERPLTAPWRIRGAQSDFMLTLMLSVPPGPPIARGVLPRPPRSPGGGGGIPSPGEQASRPPSHENGRSGMRETHIVLKRSRAGDRAPASVRPGMAERAGVADRARCGGMATRVAENGPEAGFSRRGLAPWRIVHPLAGGAARLAPLFLTSAPPVPPRLAPRPTSRPGRRQSKIRS
jgi:hypothetical protein